MNLKNLRRKIKPLIIIYLIFDIFVLGTVIVINSSIPSSANILDRVSQIFSQFFATIINPFSMIYNLFAKGLINDFINASFWTFIVLVVMYIYYQFKNGKSHDFDGSEYGSSDWSKNDEEYDKLLDGSEILNKKNGFILSKKHFLGTDLKKVKINKNILVFGGSGTGKSACYIKPNILQTLGSYVITDPKGELYRETSQFLKQNGYTIKTFNLVEPEYSDRYNPLSHIQDHKDVDIIAHTIVKGAKGDESNKADPFWDDTAIMLLKACIYYVISVLPEEEQNLSSCLNIVRAGGSDESVFDRLFEELKPEHPGRKEYEGIRVGADKTKQSIAISLISKLTHFDTGSMQRITTSNNISFEELSNSKVAIFVITPAEHSTYNYLLTIFFSQLLQTLYFYANKNGGTLKNQVYLLLDEFANIGQIPDFNKILSTTRSLGISISVVVQSLDQLEGLYKDTYENILGNCDTQLFLGSKSLKTCEYVSKSLGQKTIKYQSKSVNKDKKEIEKQGVTFSEQRQGRDLMTVDELMRLNYDDEILLVRGLKPIKAKKAWYFKYHKLRDIAKQTEFKNVSQILKPEEVEIRTMNVQKHIEDRINMAKLKMNNSSSQNLRNSIDESNLNEKPNSTDFDLQKELEKKFDELFGD